MIGGQTGRTGQTILTLARRCAVLNITPKSSVSADTVHQIAEMLRAGDYTVGDRLPGERQLAKQLRVSRASVREALRKLETVGLLEIRQGLGTFVKEPNNEAIQASLAPHILTDQTTLNKLFEIREIIEVEAAARAAQRVTPAQLVAMRQWLEAVETAVARRDAAGIVTADVEFHRQIVAATDNELLVYLMDSIVDMLRDMRWDSSNIPELLPEIIAGHRAILAAIETADSQAARLAMQSHLAGISARVQAYWARR
jgi:GntR family transcriptional repressor for pyruvate dehydrogenase complex